MNKKRDYSQILVFSAMIVTIARYIGAFVASDLGEITGVVSEGISILMGITGLGMGILDVLGGAYIFDGWRTKMPANGAKWSFRFKVMTMFVFSLFIVGLGILVPFTVSRVLHTTIGDVLGEQGTWIWSLAVNIAPYVLIGGVVSGQSGVISVKKEVSQSVIEDTGKLQESFSNDTIQVDWRKLTSDERDIVKSCKSPKEVREKFPEKRLSGRTSANWFNNSRKEN